MSIAPIASPVATVKVIEITPTTKEVSRTILEEYTEAKSLLDADLDLTEDEFKKEHYQLCKMIYNTMEGKEKLSFRGTFWKAEFKVLSL